MPEESHLQWWLVQFRAGQHRLAVANLRRQGVETFCPMRMAVVNRFGKQSQTMIPAFPSYAFVCADARHVSWRAVSNTYGVSRVVGFRPHQPARVPTELIEQLRLRCDKEGLLRPLDDLKSGDRVKIMHGPFANLVCDVDRLSGGETVRLLLSIMGHDVGVRVARSDVELAPK